MHAIKTTRLEAGLYKVTKGSHHYIVEDVSRDAGRPQWNISEYQMNPANGTLYRNESFDAADTLKAAKELISHFED